jgi:D-alanyl-D-alanine carboxypeptidase-like protein
MLGTLPSPKPSKLEDLIMRMRSGESVAEPLKDRLLTTQALLAPPPAPGQKRTNGGGLEQLAGGATGNYSTDVLMPDSPMLKTRKGDTLQKAAMRSLIQIRKQTGLPVFQLIGSSYRTPEEQAALYKQKPGLAAPPGQSLHQRGLAIDLRTDHPLFEKMRRALEAAGWRQWSPDTEPWHYSFMETG